MNNQLIKLIKNHKFQNFSHPEIFNLRKTEHQNRLTVLFKQKKIFQVVDDIEEQLYELYAIKNPEKVYTQDFKRLFEKHFYALQKKTNLVHFGKWIYFPWNGALTHLLDDADFQRVRTARNRNLITEEEQKKFYNATIGIGGLSVGNSVALAIVLQGGARHIRLADFDRLALSNLNRIRASVVNLGMLKVEITARQIYELNPYAKVEIFPEGLTTKNIKKFFLGPAKLDVVVDELDSMAIKYLIRSEAKKYKIPVAMGADNGDNAIIDIERYDEPRQPKIFQNRLGNTNYKALSGLDKFNIGRTITQFLGAENITEKMQGSLLEMGKSLVSWPQLGGAALLNGLAVAYCVRKIVTGEPLENNRAILSLDEKLTPNYNNKTAKKKRAHLTKKFKTLLKLP